MTEIIAYQPPPGTWKGIDTAGDDYSPGNVITPDIAKQLRDEDIRFVARYTRPDGTVITNTQAGGDYQGCYSLSIAEMRWILDSGLAILPVQFGVFGDAAYGNDKGRNAAACARLYGWPSGIHQFADVEGSRPSRAGTGACIEYIEAWAAACRAGGQLAGLYLTGQVPLSAHKLYGLRGITCYWSAAGPVPPNPLPRGYSIEQEPPTKVAGMACDRDTIRTDRFGQGPVLVATPEIASNWHGQAIADLLESPFLTT